MSVPAVMQRLSHGAAGHPDERTARGTEDMMRCTRALVAAALLAACPARAEVAVVDDVGRTVRLAAPAKRIVSLAPHVTEQLFAIGAGHRIVGAVEHSDFPPEAKRIPRVGDNSTIDVERLLAMKPDLVVAWTSGGVFKQVEQLRSLGLAVYFSQPRSVEDVATSLERLGRLAGTDVRAMAAARSFREKVQELQKRYARREPVTVFFQIWNRPLYTVNGEQLISDVIRLCGGRNVFAELAVLAPVVTHEAVLKADPVAIIASGMGGSRPEWLDEWRAWPDLQAVRLGNLFAVDSDIINRHSPRLAEGARQVCEILDASRARKLRR